MTKETGADIRLMIGGLVLSLVTLSPCLLPSPRHSLVPRSCREDWRKNDDKVIRQRNEVSEGCERDGKGDRTVTGDNRP